MQYVSPYFKHSGFEEWLIYLEHRFLKTTFTISFVGPESTLSGTGKYSFPRRGYELSLSIEGLGRRVIVETTLDESNSPMQKFFKNGSQSGFVGLDSERVGTCFIRATGEPQVEIRSKARGCFLTATKAEPRNVSCPLIVEGLPGAEMILEDYDMLNRARRAFLPGEPKQRHFVGSFRQVQYYDKPFGGCLEELGALVAIVDVLVKPYFMNVE